MTSVKITFHKKLNAIQCVCGYIGTSHKCKEEIRGKLSFSRALKKIVASIKTRGIEMNITS